MMKKALLYLWAVAIQLSGQHLCAQECIDGVYHIRSVEDLTAFAERVNNGENTANALLTCDLDLTDVDHTPIGTNESPYMGHFDGGTHTIENLVIQKPNDAQVGFFGTIGGLCVIENLVIGSGRIQALKAAAGLAGACRGNAGSIVKIINCGNNAYVTTRAENAAGILGCNYDGNTTVRFINCYNTASISGTKESAAICAWTGSNAGSKLVNCYNAGRVKGMDGNRNLYRSSDDKTTWENCYDVALGISKTQGDKSIKFSDVAKGVLCHKLGAPYTQTLDEDRYPTFGHKALAYVTDALYINEGDTVARLDLTDGVSEMGMEQACLLDTVTYTREFAEAGVWEPLFVPFDSKAGDWEGMTIAQLYDIRMDRSEMEFTVLSEDEAVRHNTPYIIMAKEAGSFTLQTTQVTEFNPDTAPVWCAGTEQIYTLCGNYQSTEIQPYTHSLLTGSMVEAAKTVTTLNPMRWYLTATDKTSGAQVQLPALTLKVYTNTENAISGIRPGHAEKASWYDLSGKRTTAPGKGIYVRGTKKYLHK